MIKTFTGHSFQGLDHAADEVERQIAGFWRSKVSIHVRQLAVTSFIDTTPEHSDFWYSIVMLYDELLPLDALSPTARDL